jgi:phospholipid/cholesterol/gamma-HCH transport system substrate-binding protein
VTGLPRTGLKFSVFAVVCLIAAGYLIRTTGNFRFFEPANDYTAVLDDATGLGNANSVMLAGVRVGRVEGIEIERGRAIVHFEVDSSIVPTDTWEVGTRWRDVIGNRHLYLYPVGAGAPLPPGAQIPLDRSRPDADIGVFLERITPLLRAIDPEQQNRLLTALNVALDGKEARTQELIRDLGALAGTLNGREAEIRGIVDQGNALLGALAERDEQIRSFLADFADVSTTLADRNDELVGAVTDIGEAQLRLGDLLRANDQELRSILSDLETITTTLGEDREELEEAIATAKDGLGLYLLISRWGQWFNVRAVATQAQVDGALVLCTTEAAEICSAPNSARSPAASAAARRALQGEAE